MATAKSRSIRVPVSWRSALPGDGSYTVRLEYPRYRGLSILALLALIGGGIVLANWPRSSQLAFASDRLVVGA